MYNKKLIEKIIPTLNFKFPYSVDDYSENLYFENYHKHTCESNLGLPDSAEQYSNYITKTKDKSKGVPTSIKCFAPTSI